MMSYYKTIGGFWLAAYDGRPVSLFGGGALRFRSRRAAVAFGRRYRDAAKRGAKGASR